MPSIRFSYHPAHITIGDGLAVAGRYWRASWSLWILPVIAVVLVNGLASAVFASTSLDTRSFFPTGGAGSAYTMPVMTPAQIAGPLATSLVGLVAEWFMAAIAIAGLRGRPITAGWVISAGLGTIGAAILTGVAVVIAIAVCVLMAATLPLLLVGLIVVVPVAIYVGVRLTFWTLAIFDGYGVIGGAKFSWHLSQASVLRMVGWGLVAALLSLCVSVVAIPVAFIGGLSGVTAPAEMLVAGLSATFQVFSLILMAVLYESQRWRYAPPAMPATQAQPAEYRSPLEPPPPPPPAQPWS